jgi:mediator of RNA polymerase II transcription subunit 12
MLLMYSNKAESFSMHGPIHTHLIGGCDNLLNKLGEEVLQKRNEGMPQIG